MKYPCIESTIDYVVEDGFLLRFWADQKEVENDYAISHEIVRLAQNLPTETRYDNEALIALFYSQFPKLNAMQIIRGNENYSQGTVVYFTDFNTDVHG